MVTEACIICGGRLQWFPAVHAWRHTWAPDGTQPHLAVRQTVPSEEPEHDDVAPMTIGAAGYIADVQESERDLGHRIIETREQVEARGRAMLDAAAAWNREHPYEREVILIAPEPPKVDPNRLIEHPKPEVPARPVAEGELPSSARTIRNLLVEHGWEFDAQYARGWRPDVHRRRDHTHLTHVVVIRARRRAMDERLLVSWWGKVDDPDGKMKYDSGYWMVPGDTEALGANELKTKIKAPVMSCDRCGKGPYAHQEDCT